MKGHEKIAPGVYREKDSRGSKVSGKTVEQLTRGSSSDTFKDAVRRAAEKRDRPHK